VAVDWSTEWYTSTFWILGVTIAAALGSWLIGWLLTRSTVWGRQFARLAFPYFAPSGPDGGLCSPHWAYSPWRSPRSGSRC